MFKYIIIFLCLFTLFASSSFASPSEERAISDESLNDLSHLVEIKSFDNETIKGKLHLPQNTASIKTLLIYVPGTGPNTFENKRKIGENTFLYYDLFAKELTKRGIAFFSYNTRGTSIGNAPPYFDDVDQEKFKNYLPSYEVKDLESIIQALKQDKRLSKSNIILLGWSSGSIIAPIVAERNKVSISALFLAGYCHDNLKNIMEWQLSGGSSMVFYNRHFDRNNDQQVSREEFLNDPNKIVKSVLKNESFESLDPDQDGFISQKDIALLLKDKRKDVFDAIDRNDDAWIWKNYFRITSKWAKDYFKLEANKTKLLKLNLPIYVFHGQYDANVPAKGVLELKQDFELANKTNLKAYFFENHDHDLNYIIYPLYNKIPEGLKVIFNAAEEIHLQP
jgi:pimeloyl-ACP methyl ester carboxylesterase